MHNHIRYLVIFSKESLKNNIVNNTATEHEVSNNNASLFQQIDDIYKWICELGSKIDCAKYDDLKESGLSSPLDANKSMIDLSRLRLPRRASHLLSKSFKRNSAFNISTNLELTRNDFSCRRQLLNHSKRSANSNDKSQNLNEQENTLHILEMNSLSSTRKMNLNQRVATHRKCPLFLLKFPQVLHSNSEIDMMNTAKPFI